MLLKPDHQSGRMGLIGMHNTILNNNEQSYRNITSLKPKKKLFTKIGIRFPL